MDEHVFAGTLIYGSAHTLEYAIDRFMKAESLLTESPCSHSMGYACR